MSVLRFISHLLKSLTSSSSPTVVKGPLGFCCCCCCRRPFCVSLGLLREACANSGALASPPPPAPEEEEEEEDGEEESDGESSMFEPWKHQTAFAVRKSIDTFQIKLFCSFYPDEL